MNKIQKRSLLKLAMVFIKLQLTGNILFWGTLIGSWVLHEFFDIKPVLNVALASIAAHGLFFLANKEWIYNTKEHRKKTGREIFRFIFFMTLNYFINLGLIFVLTNCLNFNEYISQLFTAFFFTIWNFLGLHFWVFETETVKHPAITYHKRKPKKKKPVRKRR